ncbi:MFS transporter [Streptomyces sp. JNUCC 64]
MSYREVLSRRVVVWALVAVGARLPVAMAPLALVFLVRERPGGYALGALLAAVYVLGEIVGAPLLGMRLRPERARPHLAAGMLAGALGFAGLGALPGAHPVLLGALAFLAGAGPAAGAGGLRALLTSLVPERLVPRTLSVESMLNSVIWALSPAAVAALALGVEPRLPPLLAAVLLVAAAAGLRLLPPGWSADPADRDGAPVFRLLVRVWPVYVMGAAGLAPLALAELVLPALLEHRGVAVGWSGPLLAGMSLGALAGAYAYGLRRWPGRLPTQALVLLCGLMASVVVLALVPHPAALATALVLGGVFQSGALLVRNLALREALPPSAVAAGYSVMYAVVGAGYAAAGSLAGVLLEVTTPSGAILGGAALVAVLIVAAAVGERRVPLAGSPGGGRTVTAGPGSGTAAAGSAPGALASPPGAAGSGPGIAGPGTGGAGLGAGAVAERAEGAPVRGGGDAEGRL